MKRVNSFNVGVEQDNYYIHLARYMFVARQIDKSTSVLEVGCGVGYGARLLADFAKEVVAMDQDKEMNKFWRKLNKKNLKFLTKIPKQKFDVVVCFEVIEHINEKNVPDFIDILKEHCSGVMYLSTPRALPLEQKSRNRQLEHKKEYSPDELKDLLNKHFSHNFIFGQNDAIISSQNLNMAWNLVAICIP